MCSPIYVPLVIGQKPSTDGEPTHKPARNLRSAKDVATMLGLGVVQVVGGTAWTWAHDAVRDALDVLVVDEAGQMSLANAVAVSGAARSLILLGDPRQLEQPIQGLHPPGADAAALEHFLGGHRTMPPELGLFIEVTHRLHPSIARFTSEVFYEGRLRAHPRTEVQRVGGDARGGPSVDGLSGTGLRFLDRKSTRLNSSH